MTSVATKLYELNQNSLVEQTVLVAAQESWERTQRARRLHQYSDALFVLIYTQLRPLLSEIVKSLLDKIPTAASEEELYVPLWSFYAHGPTKTSFLQSGSVLSYEMGLDWYVNVRYEGLRAVRVPIRVMDLIQYTDVLARISALFGSNFWVVAQKHPTKEACYELVLEYHPSGLPEGQSQELARMWETYGRKGLKDCLTSVPEGQTYVLHRGSLGEFSVGPTPPTPPPSPTLLGYSDDESTPPRTCYCNY